MNAQTRRKALLGLLLVAAVLAAVRLISQLGDGSAGASLESFRGVRGTAGTAPEVLELADLAPQIRDYEVGRDPFQFGGPSAEELEARRQAEEARRQAAEEARRRAAEEAQRRAELEAQRQADVAAAPPAPQPPPIELIFLGSFGPEQRRIAVLSDGETIFNVRVGDVVDGKFVIDQIGFESVDLKFVDFPSFPAQRLAVGG